MKYDLVLFDLDGTLANTFKSIAKYVNSGFEELGLKIYPLDYFYNLIGYGMAGVVDIVFDIEKYDEKEISKEKVVETLRKYYKKYYDYKVELYPEIDKLMDFLEENDIKKGIVTNKEHELAVNTAKNLLGKWKFEDIIGSNDKKHPRKPDSYGVDKISKETNIPKNKILYVGDMEVDLKTAENSGVDIVYCNWGFGNGKKEKNIPENIKVSNIDELIEKIK